jgi:hypothetical protein
MKRHVLAVATFALILAFGTISGSAQMMPSPDQPQSTQG